MFRSEGPTLRGKQYLLDTNILSDLIRNPAGPVAQQIRVVGENAEQVRLKESTCIF